MYPLIPVLFRHSVLFLVPVEGQPFVLMKPLVLAMGLVWSVQQEKLLKDVRWHAQTLPLADADGASAAVCLPLRKLFGWLTSLRPYQAKAATDNRDNFLTFQKNCDEILWNAWRKGEFARLTARPVARIPDLGPEPIPAVAALAGVPPVPPIAQDVVTDREDEREIPLVPVFPGEIGGVAGQVCHATDLHAFLGVASKFADWIGNRIAKYGFIENQDFTSFSKNLEKPKTGRPTKDYLITLDMAKELSMVENNAKGREARRYFIAMERQALAAAGPSVPMIRPSAPAPAWTDGPRPFPALDLTLQVAEVAMRNLRLSETSKIRLLADICRTKGVSSSFLPEFVDESLVRALTDLLKEHGSAHSTIVANQALLDLGLLEILTRKSAKGTVRAFKSLTLDGLAYGRNETSPQAPRETAPLYFAASFPTLLARIEAHLATAVSDRPRARRLGSSVH
ncbi:antA/AntB antirepressor family protein [Thiocystis minor]|uniref:antA/AntB antirepressor family protein n=1 Tax=Thiocystis minor TaxID=61597 RepID=UPI0019117EC0|nr:antA/AntB antirepressor family protein [Thiocystis minor]